MPVLVKWNDVTTNENGHQVLRKHVDDADFTVIHQVTAPTQTPQTGMIQWTDPDELDPGDYVYKIRNYTNSGLENFSQEQIVTIINPDNHKLCMPLDTLPPYVSIGDSNVIESINMTTASELSGAHFSNSHIKLSNPPTLGDQFTISMDLHPFSTMSVRGTVLECGDDYSLSVTTDNKLEFKYVDTTGNTITCTTSAAITVDQFNNVFVSANATNNRLTMHVDEQQVSQHAYSGARTPVSTHMLIGDDLSGDTFLGYIKDVSIVTGQTVHVTSCPVCGAGAVVYIWIDERYWNDDESWNDGPAPPEPTPGI